MDTVSDLMEIGHAEDLIFGVKLEDISEDADIPSSLPSEQFDE